MNYTKINVDNLWKKRIGVDFFEFQEKNIYTDITLVCSDGNVKAHKLVLVSFSTFLAKVLHDLEADSFIYFPELSVSDG